jgi:hypothetical protein
VIVMGTCCQAFQVKQPMGISGTVHTRLIIDQFLLREFTFLLGATIVNEQVPSTTCLVHQSDQKMCSRSVHAKHTLQQA